MFVTSSNMNKDIVVIAIELETTSPSFYVVWAVFLNNDKSHYQLLILKEKKHHVSAYGLPFCVVLS